MRWKEKRERCQIQEGGVRHKVTKHHPDPHHKNTIYLTGARQPNPNTCIPYTFPPLQGYKFPSPLCSRSKILQIQLPENKTEAERHHRTVQKLSCAQICQRNGGDKTQPHAQPQVHTRCPNRSAPRKLRKASREDPSRKVPGKRPRRRPARAQRKRAADPLTLALEHKRRQRVFFLPVADNGLSGWSRG